jgi:hypothetical protein
MNITSILRLVALLTLANDAPVVAKKICGRHLSLPLDFGYALLDGRSVFGSSKTIRGIVVSIPVTTAAAPLLGLDLTTDAAVAGGAMAGDLFSSFVKRRLNFPPSSQALGLDQIPESLFPMLICRDALSLTAVDIMLGVAIFLVGELLLSRLLFGAHLRDEPY